MKISINGQVSDSGRDIISVWLSSQEQDNINDMAENEDILSSFPTDTPVEMVRANEAAMTTPGAGLQKVE